MYTVFDAEIGHAFRKFLKIDVDSDRRITAVGFQLGFGWAVRDPIGALEGTY